jgi:Ricin-type beta-trefoil lectin domain-like
MRRLIRLLSLPVLAMGLVGAQLALPASSASASTYSFQFHNAWMDQCLVPAGPSDATVYQESCFASNPSANYQWFIGDSDGSGVEIVNYGYSDQCLGVAGGSVSEGAQVVMWTCQQDVANQYWIPVDCGGVGVSCMYRNLGSGLYLSIDGCNNDYADTINQWGFVSLPGGYCQLWNWAPESGQSVAP